MLVLAKVKDQMVQISTDGYKQQQTLLANQVADALSRNFVNVHNQLMVMATMPEVQDISDPAACNAKLAELLQVNQKQLGNLGRCLGR